MKTVFFVIDRFDIGGTENQLLVLLNSLDKTRIKPVLVIFHKESELKDQLKNVEILVIPFRKIISFKFIALIFSLSNEMKVRNCTEVFTYFFDATLIGVWAAKLARVKRIFICRRDMGFWYTPIKLFILKYLVNPFSQNSIANSNMVRDVLINEEKFRPEKILVFFNGYDFKNSDVTNNQSKDLFSLPKDKFIVGMISNLNRPVKRTDLLIKAASILNEKRDDLIFVIVGGGYLETELKMLSQKLGLKNKIIFLGRMQNTDSILPSFDIGVNTSESEGLSNSIIEMMYAGIPVIASKTSGNIELIEDTHTGLYFENKSEVDLARKIENLLDDNNLRDKIALNAKKYVENNFSLKTYINNYSNLIEK